MMPLSTCYEQAKRTGCLHLSHCGLEQIPEEVFEMTGLVRLDLGWNELTEIPDEIAQLTNLEQLWCNSNPITNLTPLLHQCSKLKVVDLRNTFITDIPREVGRLKNLIEFDLRGNELRNKLSDKAGNVTTVMEHLAHKDGRRRLKERLEGDLREGIYREVADGAEATRMIKDLVKSVFQEFKDNSEVKNLIRNCDRLFPTDLEVADASQIRRVFVKLRQDNEMKKLGAELELKIRNIYYDRIDPQKVEVIVNGIYRELHARTKSDKELLDDLLMQNEAKFGNRALLTEEPHNQVEPSSSEIKLKDIKFLIQYSPTLFPENSEDIDPSVLYDNMVALQEKLRRERQAAIDTLFKALKAHYADVDPPKVEILCINTAKLFKKAEEIKHLAADVNVHFPGDYLDADEKLVRKSFKTHV